MPHADGRASVATDAGAAAVVEPDAGVHRAVLTLVRTRCLGLCPAYHVSVDEDGNVVFDGAQYVAKTGRSTWHVEPQVAKKLFERMRDLCADGSCIEPTGGCALDDPQAGVRLTYPDGGRQTFITCSDPSASDASNARITLENDIDRVLETESRIACDAKAAWQPSSGIPCGEPVRSRPP